MHTPPSLLSFLVVWLASLFVLVDGLCNLENGTMAKCHELGDVSYIETYDLESLKTTVADKLLDPGLFANLSSLRHLDLSGGSLQTVEPGSFRKLANLRSLDLSDNQIEYLELASLDGLNHLHSLNLRRNRFSQLPPALARLKILKHLDVQDNPLRCNCATLRVRDLIAKRNVKMSKKTLCTGPSGTNLKGVPLLVPDTTTVCNLEEQDREMQRDQPFEASGSGSGPNDLDEEEEEEYVEVQNTPETPSQTEIETPYPETSETSTVSATVATSGAISSSSVVVTEGPSQGSSSEEDIYLDNEDKRESTPTTVQTTEENRKDALVYPVEGSGDDEEASGEGSGAGTIFTSWTGEEGKDEKADSGDSLFDILFSVFFSSTAAPEEKKDPDLEEEQFINISGLNESEEEVVVTEKSLVNQAVPSTVEVTTRVNLFSPTEELVETETVQDTSRLNKIQEEPDEESVKDELAEVSPARQSKKGMGSYVVLAALLAVLAALIGFAAYKGDFCKRKRKRGDVENGTEMKDMQKALLDSGNAAQPKIASNGTSESVPLVETAAQEQEESRDRKSPNGTTASDYSDPVKPPRRSPVQDDQRPTVQDASSLKEESLSASSIEPSPTSPTNGTLAGATDDGAPPLSPGAQRVKITLQDNPDSVPKTPILITRTLAGENLVKSP